MSDLYLLVQNEGKLGTNREHETHTVIVKHTSYDFVHLIRVARKVKLGLVPVGVRVFVIIEFVVN